MDTTPLHLSHEQFMKQMEMQEEDAFQADMVNNPPHYNHSDNGIECIDAIEAALGPEGFKAYCKGNVTKYLWRSNHKAGSPIEDIKKASWYLSRLQDAEAR